MFADVQHLHHVSQVARCSVHTHTLCFLSILLSLAFAPSPPPLSLSCRDGRWCMTPHIRAAQSMGLDRKRAPATLPRESLRRRHAATGRSPVERAGVRREHWQDLLGPRHHGPVQQSVSGQNARFAGTGQRADSVHLVEKLCSFYHLDHHRHTRERAGMRDRGGSAVGARYIVRGGTRRHKLY